MPRKTEPVYELVVEVMESLPKPYGEDVVEEVCVHIEQNPEWMKRYERLVTVLSRDSVNNAIGDYVKQRSGMRTLRQALTTRTSLMKSYGKLTP